MAFWLMDGWMDELLFGGWWGEITYAMPLDDSSIFRDYRFTLRVYFQFRVPHFAHSHSHSHSPIQGANENLLPDGSGRLWNDTRWKNYGQEKHLNDFARTRPARVVGLRHAYVYHYRGGTLDSRNCKNGWLDCATWQTNHRPDMASKWWTPEKNGV